jgi:2,3,4,5-tetrahydropyridine-2,6-dicarboxylate N-succinyltransferase
MEPQMQALQHPLQQDSSQIEEAWENRNHITPNDIRLKALVAEIMQALDSGALRVAEKTATGWQTHQWIKKAILLSFRLNDMALIGGGPFQIDEEDPLYAGGEASWYDKVPSKFQDWDAERFNAAGFRAVPGCFVRHSAYIAKGVVLMPSFVNVGAFVDEGTMIDTWSTVGSCAQIGKNCHISGGVGIGGVLEPVQAGPVIIEDNCFIGARSEVAEGVVVETGAVLSMGVYLGASTKIIDRETGEIHYGRVPAYSVVVPGSIAGKPMPDGSPSPSLYAAVIVKKVDEKTRSKTSINELLRM